MTSFLSIDAIRTHARDAGGKNMSCVLFFFYFPTVLFIRSAPPNQSVRPLPSKPRNRKLLTIPTYSTYVLT
jgi:hypothetical protein